MGNKDERTTYQKRKNDLVKLALNHFKDKDIQDGWFTVKEFTQWLEDHGASEICTPLGPMTYRGRSGGWSIIQWDRPWRILKNLSKRGVLEVERAVGANLLYFRVREGRTNRC